MSRDPIERAVIFDDIKRKAQQATMPTPAELLKGDHAEDRYITKRNSDGSFDTIDMSHPGSRDQRRF